jgi:hypothetical protein
VTSPGGASKLGSGRPLWKWPPAQTAAATKPALHDRWCRSERTPVQGLSPSKLQQIWLVPSTRPRWEPRVAGLPAGQIGFEVGEHLGKVGALVVGAPDDPEREDWGWGQRSGYGEGRSVRAIDSGSLRRRGSQVSKTRRSRSAALRLRRRDPGRRWRSRRRWRVRRSRRQPPHAVVLASRFGGLRWCGVTEVALASGGSGRPRAHGGPQ